MALYVLAHIDFTSTLAHIRPCLCILSHMYISKLAHVGYWRASETLSGVYKFELMGTYIYIYICICMEVRVP